jgi:two-component system sensor histidine kinase VicK
MVKTRTATEAENATDLAAEKAKADALFASIGEAVLATDEHGKIMRVNGVTLELLEYEETELVGQSYLQTVQAYDNKGRQLDPFSRPIMRALQEGRPVTENLQFAKKDGTLFPVVVTASPIMLDEKPIGMIEVFRDITLEQQIDRAKTEFVSLASHQLRTPLTAMRWFIELLLRGTMGELTTEQKVSLEQVHVSNLRMIELVSALLSVARIEIGSLTFSPVPSDITKLAHEAAYELNPLITDKKIQFVEEYDDDLPLIPLDPDLTHIIFQNLLTNAVKYTPAGGRVTLRIERVKRSVQITVCDTGYGIPKSQQKQLFTKLFRADNVRDKDTDGTGLGLYIVQSIVENSHGKIWFESKENSGSKFFIKLPLKGMPATPELKIENS